MAGKGRERVPVFGLDYDKTTTAVLGDRPLAVGWGGVWCLMTAEQRAAAAAAAVVVKRVHHVELSLS